MKELFFIPHWLVPFFLLLVLSCNQTRSVSNSRTTSPLEISFGEQEVMDSPALKDEVVETSLPVYYTDSVLLYNKYQKQLELSTENTLPYNVLRFIDTWMGSKYKYGGNSKNGIDCSGLIGEYYSQIKSKDVPRRVAEISKLFTKTAPKNRSCGDVIVFNLNGRRNNHGGIYLIHDYFIHASSSKGVVLSSLTSYYYSKQSYNYCSYPV